jgi:hypothetical protein
LEWSLTSPESVEKERDARFAHARPARLGCSAALRRRGLRGIEARETRGRHASQEEHDQGVVAESFWDALILSAAQAMEFGFLLSEDLSAGQEFAGLRVVSTFLTRPVELGG